MPSNNEPRETSPPTYVEAMNRSDPQLVPNVILTSPPASVPGQVIEAVVIPSQLQPIEMQPLGKHPQLLYCPSCQEYVLTKTKRIMGGTNMFHASKGFILLYFVIWIIRGESGSKSPFNREWYDWLELILVGLVVIPVVTCMFVNCITCCFRCWKDVHHFCPRCERKLGKLRIKLVRR